MKNCWASGCCIHPQRTFPSFFLFSSRKSRFQSRPERFWDCVSSFVRVGLHLALLFPWLITLYCLHSKSGLLARALPPGVSSAFFPSLWEYLQFCLSGSFSLLAFLASFFHAQCSGVGRFFERKLKAVAWPLSSIRVLFMTVSSKLCLLRPAWLLRF